MEFRRVRHLEAGKKYRICQDFIHYGTYLYSTHGIYTFVNINGQHNFQDYYYFDTTFYEPIFQRDRIQSDMEERALQLILKNITGDENFTYIV